MITAARRFSRSHPVTPISRRCSQLSPTFEIRSECFQKKPYKVELTDKAKFICQCGQSAKFPLCDGSHKKYKDGQQSPLKLDLGCVENKKAVFVCGCGYSKQKLHGVPYCDGSHKHL